MAGQFRLKYASEVSGALLLLTTLALVAAVFVSARRQGWFEKTIELRTMFATEEGAFGLQEGGQVLVRNTVAGRVGKIEPVSDGRMQATLVIRERFRPLIRHEAVARVSRTYGIAGDAYVEIISGKGRLVADGDEIKSRKSEEVMETVQRVLDEIRARGLPLLEETHRIMANVSGITSNINQGQGLAGAVVADTELARSVKDTVGNANKALELSQEAVQEITLLVRGVQRHWLLRGYVKDARSDAAMVVPPPVERSKEKDLQKRLQDALEKARVADSPKGISENAYWLGVLLLTQGGHDDEVAAILRELRVEALRGSENAVRAILLEGEMAWARGEIERALDAAARAEERIDRSVDDPWSVEVRLLAANANFAGNDKREAFRHVRKAERLARGMKSAQYKGRVLGVKGGMLMATGNAGDAVEAFDEQVSCYRGIGWYRGMAEGLTNAGEACLKAGRRGDAADRFCRAARSLWTQDRGSAQARVLAGRAADAAGGGVAPEIAEQACAMLAEMRAGDGNR